MKSKSFQIAKKLLGKTVIVKIDRPLGSRHPKWNFEYLVNYGYLEGVLAPDGEEFDAYVLKIEQPIKEFRGEVIAIVHRLDDDDKLVVVPRNTNIASEKIEELVQFQEKWFKHKIYM